MSKRRISIDEIHELEEIFSFIQANHVTSFASFLDYCAENRPEWFSIIVTSGCYRVDKYIKSYTRKLKNLQRLQKSNAEGNDRNIDKKGGTSG